jgi:CMP-2-keto-3-deoxyoctulosonic acid synthetase
MTLTDKEKLEQIRRILNDLEIHIQRPKPYYGNDLEKHINKSKGNADASETIRILVRAIRETLEN